MPTKRWFLGLSLLAAFFGCGGAVTTDDSVSLNGLRFWVLAELLVHERADFRQTVLGHGLNVG